MGRYRSPSKPGSPYITPEGAKRMREELDYLWRDERPRVTKAVTAAAAEGDRSENAEYIYGKKRLREIDSRVRFLTKRLDVVKEVAVIPTDKNKVYFAAWVTLLDEQGVECCYRIVGPDEFDMEPQYISMDSPMASALMGKALDDEVRVQLPDGEKTFEIIGIRYDTTGA